MNIAAPIRDAGVTRALAGKVAGNGADVVLWDRHFHHHDRLEQHGFGFGDGFSQRKFARGFE